MKKLTFSFILMIGFCFGFSSISAQTTQSHLSVGYATLANVNGLTKAKDLVIAGIEAKLPVLYFELNQNPIDEVTAKTKMTEALLYKGMLSDITGGKAVRAAYDDNIAVFLRDFPQYNEELVARKKLAVNGFHQIIFFN